MKGGAAVSGNTYHQAPDSVRDAPPGCPLHEGWSPLDQDYLADPYPIAAALRDEHPVFYAPELGHVVVTRMEDIDTVFMNPDVFASTNVQDPIFPLHPTRQPSSRPTTSTRSPSCRTGPNPTTPASACTPAKASRTAG